MGFLHKLWDETLAGPLPESGLGKLRKYNSFNGARSVDSVPPVVDQFPISRSIKVFRSGGSCSGSGSGSGSIPSSPNASSTPNSPRSPCTPGGNVKKFIKDKEPKGPTGYDWIVLSALDR